MQYNRMEHFYPEIVQRNFIIGIRLLCSKYDVSGGAMLLSSDEEIHAVE